MSFFNSFCAKWQQWSTDIDQVLEYCKNDVRSLEFIVKSIEKNKYIVRTTNAGKKTKWIPFVAQLRNVYTCIQQIQKTPPDQAWLTSPPDLHAPYMWAIDYLQNA